MNLAKTREGMLISAAEALIMAPPARTSLSCPTCGTPLFFVGATGPSRPHFRVSASRPHETDCIEAQLLDITFEAQDADAAEASVTFMSIASRVSLRAIEYFANHPHQLKTMDRRLFEEFVAELFKGFGYEVELTKQTRDGGFDLIAVTSRDYINQRFLIECKRPDPKNPVRLDVVKHLHATKIDQGANKAILVTTTHFTGDAHRYGKRHAIELDLKDFDDLVEWLHHYLRIKARA
ncbi:restriction endonuclease [Pseudomonas syringae group genomosp. 3]|uniref:restriction endonuclease n=1 Tax=Pseudomonas syringae group genomosp. 3 TaxID=251701 RepID=UPI001604C79B|nr:restriction endonuclease [Pseudomonas syringae group genomosp. 3]QQN28589.1 restriction endonuclease [Pseudomonas syringae pv. maculicola]